MLKNQSVSESIDLHQREFEIGANNMEYLKRRILLNFANLVISKEVNALRPVTSAEVARNFTATRHYADSKKQNLLRYPALPLDETMKKFLKSAKPLVTVCEFKKTKADAEEFMKAEGAALQALLEKAAQKEENWLAHRWLRGAYLQYRDPVTIYSSPGMTFPLTNFKTDDEYLSYASRVIYVMNMYKRMIDNGEIPVVKMGKLELDNAQFYRIFGTCRIPKPTEDELQFNPESKHIVVIHNNHFYKLNLYTKDCRPLHPCIIQRELSTILKDASTPGCPYGILTTDHRDNWAIAYSQLIKDPENGKSVAEIQKALFTVSLDQKVSAAAGEELNVQSGQLIHGGGGEQNSGNRWMDKTIQVIINRNGMSGFTYEHSPAEGQPIALMSDYIVQNMKNEELLKHASAEGYDTFTKLKFNPSDELSKLISEARERTNKIASDLDMFILRYQGYGKEFLKKQKVSPDSFVQMALQYAFYKVHATPAAQYETAHLRIFNGGRTETIRSCSNESVAFAQAMGDDCITDKTRAELLRLAVNEHRAYTTMALQGKGVDRHFFGLKQMAIENKMPIPQFFRSVGVVKSSNFRMSTSQVASTLPIFMCYGPLTHDGYSSCYNPRDNEIIVAVGAWKSNKETCAREFACALQHCFDDMKTALEAGTPPQPPKSKL